MTLRRRRELEPDLAKGAEQLALADGKGAEVFDVVVEASSLAEARSHEQGPGGRGGSAPVVHLMLRC